MTPRAPSLPPEERRAAIVAAARPMIAERGAQVTTKQVADAAGIAEGTLFRVFPTKADLLGAVIEDVVDPTPVVDALATLNPATLTEATRAIIEVVQGNVRSTSMFFTALFARAGEIDKRGTSGPPPHPSPKGHDQHAARMAKVNLAVQQVLAPFADELSVPVPLAATVIQTLSLSALHPFLNTHQFDDLDTVTALVMHGFAKEN